MFCKQCGKSIDDDSKFCRYCGAEQESSEKRPSTNKVEIAGNVNAQISPTFPNLTSFIKEHSVLVIVYTLWFLTNLILLLSGSGHNHFWPYIHKTGGYYDRFYQGGTYVKETTKIDWNLKYYGWPEFIVYIAIVPLVLFIIYKAYNKYEQYQFNKPNSIPPLTPPNSI